MKRMKMDNLEICKKEPIPRAYPLPSDTFYVRECYKSILNLILRRLFAKVEDKFRDDYVTVTGPSGIGTGKCTCMYVLKELRAKYPNKLFMEQCY